jgi:alkylation response protein AidB-like acyl-CoA dehydrogenase
MLIEIRPITQINGGRSFNKVRFDGVRVPDSLRIDEVGAGWRVAITTLMNERASAGRRMGGGSMDLLDFARTLELGGAPALADPAVRQRVAELYVHSRGIELTGLRIWSALSQGRMPGPEASLAKLVGVRLAQETASCAIELQGASGAIADEACAAGEWQQRLLTNPGLRIAGGTDEVLRNIIAERVLQLPPEVRADKAAPFREVPNGPPRKSAA